MMKKIKHMSRDNARTPMQWNDKENAGFSEEKPWLEVNHNYKKINVEKDKTLDESLFKYYQKIIGLRKNYPLITYGYYQDIDFYNKNIYTYKRFDKTSEIIVLCNATEKEITYRDRYEDYQIILSNYKKHTKDSLKPYEAIVYYKKTSD